MAERGAPPRTSPVRFLLALLGAALATLVLLELGALVLARAGLMDAPRPGEGTAPYWSGRHPVFGVWHQPESHFTHRSACFQATYRSNSVGARDVERALRSDAPRVVVLGDSFFEGWGLSDAMRLSNRLERKTGIEHLNFAMAHFGPYQEYLVYRELAGRYDHDAVLLGIVPENDFIDIDFETAREMDGYKHRYWPYRPYLVGEPPDLWHLDYLENPIRRFLRHESWAFNAVLGALAGIERRLEEPKRPVASEPAAPRVPSRFYDFSERQFQLLEAILGKLSAEAGERKLAVVLVPVQKDLLRYAESGDDPLSERLRALGGRLGFEVVNLLPAMSRHTRGWESYFFSCDYHWSAFAHAVAQQYVLEALSEDFYDFERRAANAR